MKSNVDKRIEEYFKETSEEEGITVEEVQTRIVADWGKLGLRGYAVFQTDDVNPELKVIQKIDEMMVYDSDLDAGRQAQKDGIKLIPYRKQPKRYPYNCYRFVDTENNRRLLKGIMEGTVNA